MTDILDIYTVLNQRNVRDGVCMKTIKRVANGMLTDRKNRKVGEVNDRDPRQDRKIHFHFSTWSGGLLWVGIMEEKA